MGPQDPHPDPAEESFYDIDTTQTGEPLPGEPIEQPGPDVWLPPAPQPVFKQPTFKQPAFKQPPQQPPRPTGFGGGIVSGTLIPVDALQVSGKVPPFESHLQNLCIKAVFAAGERGGRSSSLNAQVRPAAFFPSEEVWVSFQWWVPPDYPWSKGQVRKAGGKVIGLVIGQGDASGGRYSSTGASFRVMWGWNGGAAPYVYPQMRSGGKPQSVRDLDQSPEVEQVAQLTSGGTHLFTPRGGKDNPAAWPMRFVAGEFNNVSMDCRLNTPGQKNGILKLTVNGVSRKVTTFRYRNDNSPISHVSIHPFFGGGSNDYAPPSQTHCYYTNFRFAKTDPFPNN